MTLLEDRPAPAPRPQGRRRPRIVASQLPTAGRARMGHRPALDGIRAVAVIGVLLYHGGVPGFRGGFLGVDVFFVLSGFLITTLLVEERTRRGRIGLRHFWARRFRRLLPAALLVLLAVTFYAWFAASPAQRSSIRGDILATLGYVANWRFVATGQSYFDAFLDPSPLRHAWSLAVEEQWYLLWPLVVVGSLRFTRGRIRPLIAPVAATALVSAALMALLYDSRDPSRVYYGTDTRAQGVLIGSALALYLIERRRNRPRHATDDPRWRSVGGWVALAAVVLAMLSLGDRTPALYLGGFAVVSAVAAVLVAVAADPRPSPVQQALSWAPLGWIGQRSYGLYLWHWPVFVWLDNDRTGLDGPALFALRIAVSLALTVASFELVEKPVRFGQVDARRFVGGSVAAATAVVLLALPLTSTGTRFPSVETITAAPLTTAPGRPGPDTTAATLAPGALGPTVPSTAPPSTAPAAPEPIKVLVLGDSTALVFSLGFPKALEDQGVLQTGQATVGCGITEGRPYSDKGFIPGGEGKCLKWRDDWTAAVTTVQPDVVVMMVGAWELLDHKVGGRILRFGTPEWADSVRAALDEGVRIAGSTGAPVAIMTVPCMQESPDALYPTQARNDPNRVAALNLLLSAVAQQHPGATLVDYQGFLCPGGQYTPKLDGVEMRFDGVHLSDAGAKVTWNWLVPQLREIVERTNRSAAVPAS